MADSKYKEYTIQKKSDVKSVVRKSFISRAEYEFQGGGAVASGELVLKNIMGEEDVYRFDPVTGMRADHPLRGRIVWSTGVKANSKVYYSLGNESFDMETAVQNDPVDSNGVYYHEIFLYNLNIDSEYAFQVESYDAAGNSLRSETYWFHTHGEILLLSEIEAIVALIIKNVDKQIDVSQALFVTSVFAATELGEGPIVNVVDYNAPVSLADTTSFTSDEDEFFTEVQTTVTP